MFLVTERTKVNRKIKKAEKELKEAKSDEEKNSAQKLLDELNIDLNYINVRCHSIVRPAIYTS
jgi:rRNA-processing protein Efg1